MKLTVDIVKEIVEGLALTATVSSASFSSPNTTVTVTDSYHLREQMTVEIGGTDYQVLTIDAENNSFTVAGDLSGLIGASVVVPNPFYFHGTPIATNESIVVLDDPSKVPMIYLYERLRETRQSKNSGLLRTADLTLYFLDNANFADWTTQNFYTKRIYGLNKLVEAFILQVQNNTHFETLDTVFNLENYERFGTFRELQGRVSKIFDDPLTGVEVSFTLNIKNLDCL